MKGITKHLLLVFSLMLILFRPIQAYAEINEQDNLKVKLQVEKIENTDDEVKAILRITNIGIRSIDNVNIEGIIPEGMSIKDKNNLTKEIGRINAGDTITHEFYCKVDKTIVNEEDDSNNKDEDTSGPVIDVNGGNDYTTTGDSNNTWDKVQTGDNNIILILTMIIVVCSLLIVLLSKKKVRNNKKVISLFICLSLLTSLLEGAVIVKADERSKKEISVKEDITIDDKLYTLETIVKYEIPSNEVVPSGSTITRGQWIAKLVETLDLKNQQEVDWDELEYPFIDIEGTQYEEDILYAYANAILVDEGNSFNPNAPATREFATVTSIKALGFVGDQDIICEDVSDITYLKEVDVAVTMGIIALEGNNFYPLRILTESESQYIIEGIQGVLKSSEIDENYDNTFEYKDDVIELPDDVVYEINGTTITFKLDDIVNNLKVGDIIVLPNETPYKLTNITVNSNIVIVETEEPTLEETLEYIDVQGYATGDMSTFVPAEGVEIIENNTSNARVHLDEEGEITVPGSITLGINGGGISGQVEVAIPKVEYKVDIDVGVFDVDVNNAYLKFLMETEFTAELELGSFDGGTGDLTDGIIELGQVPIVGIPGVTVVAAVSIDYEIGGSAKLVYSINGSVGAQILNNNLRAIKTLRSNLDLPQLEAEGKIGPKVSGLIEICGYWNLIDFSIGAGVGLNGTLAAHPGMICLDFNIFLYAELTALDDCKIREWLDLSYTWEIWNSDNSPIKWHWHYENLHKVPDCTYGEGTIKGTVAEATDRNTFIKDALIQVYKESGSIAIEETTSDSNGQYELSLAAGTYKVKISKNGYISFESIEIVRGGEETYIQTYLMVGEGTSGEVGHTGGKITNAVTGGNVSGITINVRSGWNNVYGDPLLTTITDAEGKYEVLLPLGNYTVEMIKEGYITKHYNIYVISGNALNQNNTLVPCSSEMPTGDLRVVLTWGETPRDLDSHLIGPTADGTDYFHIYFRDKVYSENNIIYADLDLDDTSSYGPETTTVYNMNSEGKYSFYVHDYTNRHSSSSVAMSNSGAKVDVYKGDTLYATYNIPTNTEGTYWHVFDFDAETNVIVPVNNFVDGINYNKTDSTLFNMSTPIWEMEEKLAN